MVGVPPVEPPADSDTRPHPYDPPPGYPREYERDLVLRDGRHVSIRPIVPSDSSAIEMAIRHADPETLYHRFLTERPHLTPTLLARLTTLDYIHRFALVAVDPRTGHGLAVARYSEVEPGVADVAVVVDPAWRRVGLATALIETLGRAAVDRGVRTFTAYHLAENRPVSALCHLVPGGHARVHDGIVEYSVNLDPAQLNAARTAEQGRPTSA